MRFKELLVIGLLFVCSPLTAQTWWEDAPNAVPDYKKREWLHWYEDSGLSGATIDLAEDLDPPATDESQPDSDDPFIYTEECPFEIKYVIGKSIGKTYVEAIDEAQRDAFSEIEWKYLRNDIKVDVLSEQIIRLEYVTSGEDERLLVCEYLVSIMVWK